LDFEKKTLKKRTGRPTEPSFTGHLIAQILP